MRDRHLMIVGAGNVGSHVLDMLTRRDEPPRITLVGRDEEYLRRRANLSTLVAHQLGFAPHVEYAIADVTDLEPTAEVIARAQPDVIFSTVSLQAWWVINELPKPVFEELDEAQIGPWLPMQLTLIYRLMQAVRESGYRPVVTNAALPDATHTILDKVGLAPTVGIGNVANVIPGLRRAAAILLECDLAEVDVQFVAEAFVSHRIPRTGESGGAPYHLTVRRNGADVTERIDVDALFGLLTTKVARLGGVTGAVLTAASAVTVLDGILGDTGAETHAPGPNALVGGYPIRAYAERIEVVLPNGVSSEEADRINREALAYDGIAEIRDDGSVVYGARHAEIMRQMLGYDCAEMALDETADRAQELAEKYRAFKGRFE